MAQTLTVTNRLRNNMPNPVDLSVQVYIQKTRNGTYQSDEFVMVVPEDSTNSASIYAPEHFRVKVVCPWFNNQTQYTECSGGSSPHIAW